MNIQNQGMSMDDFAPSFKVNGNLEGVVTAVTATTITIGAGTGSQLVNNDGLFTDGLPEGAEITLARKCRSILGTAVTAEVLDGSQYYRELKNSLNIADVTIAN